MNPVILAAVFFGGGLGSLMRHFSILLAKNLFGDGFQRNRLRPPFEQDPARGIERGGPAFLGAQAFSSY